MNVGGVGDWMNDFGTGCCDLEINSIISAILLTLSSICFIFFPSEEGAAVSWILISSRSCSMDLILFSAMMVKRELTRLRIELIVA